jgi:hypothetical protein
MSVDNASLPGQSEYPFAIESAVQPAVQPTAEQLERRQRLRRFNRWVLYVPVGLTFLAWLGLIGGLLWLSVAGDWFAMDTNQTHYRQLLSGVADTLTMIMLTPLLLLCALPTVGAIALVLARRQSAKGAPAGETSLPLLWRIDNIITEIHDTIARTTPRVAKPLIDAHATAAYIKRFILVIKQTISQEILGNDDD